MREHRYGRGTFDTHPAYIEYMHSIVEHPNYAGMPNAVSEDGRVNWQVSSGRTTSFYTYYEARKEWWERKATALGIDDKDRLTITARIIHPSGWRTCRLCGEPRNVGYYYLNRNGVRKASATAVDAEFALHMPVDEVLAKLGADGRARFAALFPERSGMFATHGISAEAFDESRHLRTSWLTPGYMGDPPDRLDGFHDYCVYCREQNDPGRSKENLPSGLRVVGRGRLGPCRCAIQPRWTGYMQRLRPRGRSRQP